MRWLLPMGLLVLSCAQKRSAEAIEQAVLDDLRRGREVKSNPCSVTEGDASPAVQLGCEMSCAMVELSAPMRARMFASIDAGPIVLPRESRITVTLGGDAGTQQVLLTRLGDGGLRCAAER
ncbi:MAG: hypothetical protein ACYC8T_07685 [Myxococcaceae bacterium]